VYLPPHPSVGRRNVRRSTLQYVEHGARLSGTVLEVRFAEGETGACRRLADRAGEAAACFDPRTRFDNVTGRGGDCCEEDDVIELLETRVIRTVRREGLLEAPASERGISQPRMQRPFAPPERRDLHGQRELP
jgi:hypothetical protein